MGEGGFVAEFVSDVWKPLMRDIITKKIKIVTNAGGMNPLALKAAIEKAVEGTGLPTPVVAAVIGDDLLPTFDKLVEGGKLRPFEVEVRVGSRSYFWARFILRPHFSNNGRFFHLGRRRRLGYHKESPRTKRECLFGSLPDCKSTRRRSPNCSDWFGVTIGRVLPLN
jgi:hypothetical protein